MQNINIQIKYFEQELKQLIEKSKLPITVLSLILKNTQNEIEECQNQYFINLFQHENEIETSLKE